MRVNTWVYGLTNGTVATTSSTLRATGIFCGFILGYKRERERWKLPCMCVGCLCNWLMGIQRLVASYMSTKQSYLAFVVVCLGGIYLNFLNPKAQT